MQRKTIYKKEESFFFVGFGLRKVQVTGSGEVGRQQQGRRVVVLCETDL